MKVINWRYGSVGVVKKDEKKIFSIVRKISFAKFIGT